jgi:hypothetical protein
MPAVFSKMVNGNGYHCTEWEDRIKKGYVKAAVNYALRERLVTVSEEPSYEGYCRQVEEIADRMAELQHCRLQKRGLEATFWLKWFLGIPMLGVIRTGLAICHNFLISFMMTVIYALCFVN